MRLQWKMVKHTEKYSIFEQKLANDVPQLQVIQMLAKPALAKLSMFKIIRAIKGVENIENKNTVKIKNKTPGWGGTYL